MTLTRKESIYLVLYCTFVLVVSVVLVFKAATKQEDLFGSNLREVYEMKNDCEKDLPRDQECTLLYEFVPTKTKGGGQ